jgi:hypothetical protein
MRGKKHARDIPGAERTSYRKSHNAGVAPARRCQITAVGAPIEDSKHRRKT